MISDVGAMRHCSLPMPVLESGFTIRGGELGVLRVRDHPLSMQVHPLTAKSTPWKWKENLMKHPLKPISNKFKVVLMFILGLCLGKTAVIYSFALNWTATNGKAPPRGLRILHLCLLCLNSDSRIVNYLHTQLHTATANRLRNRSWSFIILEEG